MFYCKILDDTYIAGTAVAKDEIYEVEEATLKQLIRCKKAERCEAPETAAPEATKAKATKVK